MASYPFVAEIDAFDYSPKSVEQAEKAYSHPKVTRWVGDFARDAPRRTYDLVVSFQVFEHLSEPVRPVSILPRRDCSRRRRGQF